MKANLVMNEYYEIDDTFLPASETVGGETVCELIGRFLFLQVFCAYNLFCDLMDTEAHLSS